MWASLGCLLSILALMVVAFQAAIAAPLLEGQGESDLQHNADLLAETTNGPRRELLIAGDEYRLQSHTERSSAAVRHSQSKKRKFVTKKKLPGKKRTGKGHGIRPKKGGVANRKKAPRVGELTYASFQLDYGKKYIKVYKDSTGTEVIQLSMVKGCFDGCGARIRSQKRYLYGVFSAKIRTPPQTTKGICSTFYLSTRNNDKDRTHLHEIDVELPRGGDKTQLLTNWWANSPDHIPRKGSGEEEVFNLPTKPYASFLQYTIVWTANRIAWYVDGSLVREVRKTDSHFPDQPMYLYLSIWANTGWLGPVDWGLQPFAAEYKDISISGVSQLLPGDSTICPFGQKIC